jgi:outer membrane lipoprotein-sorting protein
MKHANFMRLIRKSWLTSALLAIAALAAARPPVRSQAGSSWTVETVLAQLDRAAGDFHALTADLEHTKVTVVVDDKSTETGQIFVRRDDKMRIDITKPDPRTILRNGGTLYVYTPKIKRVEEFDLGKRKALVDQYVLLGFGTKGSDLRKNYLITLQSEEALDNRKTLLLELTPKSDQVREQISKIQMWIDESAWVPVQQKFYETGSGDYFIFHYTNVVRNTRLSDSLFKPDWPKGVTKIKPHV